METRDSQLNTKLVQILIFGKLSDLSEMNGSRGQKKAALPEGK